MNEAFLKLKIPELQTCLSISEINKGFSGDKKYLVEFEGGSNYLLRTASLSDYPRKEAEFKILKEMKNYEVLAQEPIKLGKIEELGICYYLLTYLEGRDASELLPYLTEKQQYEVGRKAGRDLAEMNAHPAPISIDPWYGRMMKKYQRYVNAYHSCGLRIKGDEKILEYIESNHHYIKNRPNRFQHDDFHVGNILVNGGEYGGVIDFNRYDWGDPFHEFVKVALFSREVSVPFSRGQLDGYFNQGFPEEFWKLYCLYTGMTIFSSIVWSLKVTPDRIEQMMERLYRILEEHKYFEVEKPDWYSQV
jgi:aminoglycoside phosphotransferase (APT) family kinase protein